MEYKKEDLQKNDNFCATSFVFSELDKKTFDLSDNGKTNLSPEQLIKMLNENIDTPFYNRIIEVMARFIELENTNESLSGVRELLGEPNDLSLEEKEEILSSIEDFFNRNKDL